VTSTVSFAANDRMELECVGETITALVNGTAIGGMFTWTDTGTALTTGYVGVGGASAASPQGDNLKFGDMVSSGGLSVPIVSHNRRTRMQ